MCLLRFPIDVSDPVCLLYPKGRSSTHGATGYYSHEKEFGPHFDLRFSLRNRPALLIQAGRVEQFMHEHPRGLLGAIDVDALCAAGACVSAIDVLGSQVLTDHGKCARSGSCIPDQTPRSAAHRWTEPLENAGPEIPVGLRNTVGQKGEHTG